jgi:hypothetical protein
MSSALATSKTWHLKGYMQKDKLIYYILHTAAGQNYKKLLSADRERERELIQYLSNKCK